MKKVVAALIYDENGNVLLCQRNDGNSEVVGKWEFPGGKIEPGETPYQAIEREIKEELELIVKAEAFVDSTIYEYPNGVLELSLYECSYVDGEIHLNNHYKYEYVNRENICNYDLCPADIPLAETVKTR